MFSAATKTDNVSSAANYIEDVFSTYLYTGNSSTQTITNGIDLSTKGGLVWIKNRDTAGYSNLLTDTVRGTTKALSSNTTAATRTDAFGLTAFNSTGFSLNFDSEYNQSNKTFVSWTFREQAKFFDVVTWSTTGSTNARIPHNLGSVPGFYVIKRVDGIGSWWVYHRSLGRSAYVRLDVNDGSTSVTNCWGTTDPTSTDFGINEQYFTNGSSGLLYVAYVFAHDAGGFGLTGTDNVISCGTFTTDGSGAAGDITLGYESQLVMFKRSDGAGNWQIVDTMRGSSLTSYIYISPTVSSAESSSTSTQGIYPTATGFYVGNNFPGANQTYIYIAIRRGPMKTPTTGTSVFSPNTYTGTGATLSVSGISFPPDLVIPKWRSNGGGGYSTRPGALYDKLRGPQKELAPTSTAAESTQSTGLTSFNQSGFTIGTSSVINSSPDPYISWNFLRAPGFFDEVCYTGTGSYPFTINHNLTVVPELMIFKSRNNAEAWWTIAQPITSPNANWYQNYLTLNSTAARLGDTSSITTAPTSTTITVSDYYGANNNQFVLYLFATCAGVSKVGSYTGTGALQTVNCGFSAGARFVLIKRTDSTGDWYVWDSARGISSGNDPYLLINSTAAEDTGTNYVDTDTTGFKVTAAAPAALNASGGTYIFLAIA